MRSGFPVSRRRERGFTLLELTLVVCVVALLAAFALDRLRDLEEQAEAAAAEQTLLALKSALRIRSAELIFANRWEDLARLPQQNPFDLLEETPGNYRGDYAGGRGEGGGGAPGSGAWYFDGGAHEVIYALNRQAGFSAAFPGTQGATGNPEMRFHPQGLDSLGKPVPEGGRTGVASVGLRARGEYVWLGRRLF